MDDHRTLQTETLQGSSHGIEKIFPGHPQHLCLGSQRINQRAEQVEHRADTQAASQRGQVHQGRMPGRSEEECDARRWNRLDDRLQRSLEIEAQPLQHIGGTDLSTGTAVAVLRHLHAAGGGGEGNSGGDVEGVCTIAARATGVHQKTIGPGTGQRAGLPQHRCHRRQFFCLHPLGPEASQKGTGLDGR